jgi:hypothetical protein
MPLDTSFDFDLEAHPRDADSHSVTLRHYHQLLWSNQPLPSGRLFILQIRGSELHHASDLGTFRLSSDAIATSLSGQLKGLDVMRHIPSDEIRQFKLVNGQIGGRIVFPANRVDRKNTINGARGLNRKIQDRFDLTLECVRRHYVGQWSPLSEDLNRYGEFFALFEDFRGYVRFFMLQDLVSADGTAIRFFLEFDEFQSSPLPMDRESYTRYRLATTAFVEARNRRISAMAEPLVLPEIALKPLRNRAPRIARPLPLLENLRAD